MFRRTICAMTAWAVLSGAANAQPPAADPYNPRARMREPFAGLRAERRLSGLVASAPQEKSDAAQPKSDAAQPKSDAAQPKSDVPQSKSDAPPKPETKAGPATSPMPPDAVPVYTGIAPPFSGKGPLSSGLIWTRLEALVWAASGQHVPPAITASDPGMPENFAGILGNPGTRVLFPLDRTNNEFRGGFRLNAGYWFDDSQALGIEGDFFFLNNSKKGLTVASDAGGNQIIARPFINAITMVPDAVVAAFPNQRRGVLDVRAENWAIGGGVNLLYDLVASPCNRLDVVVGYRYLGVFDEVEFEEDSTALREQGIFAFGARTQVLDRFNTANNFNGGVIGLSGERTSGVWFVGGKATVALGGVQQIVIIDGRTVITPPSGLAQASFQGLYAQPSNIGRRTENAFAVLPEVSLRVGVQFSESARFYIGYNWMYLSNVVRAGDQIDTRVNPNFIFGSGGPFSPLQLPAFLGFRTTDYWMQGVSFGMEVRF